MGKNKVMRLATILVVLLLINVVGVSALIEGEHHYLSGKSKNAVLLTKAEVNTLYVGQDNKLILNGKPYDWRIDGDKKLRIYYKGRDQDSWEVTIDDGDKSFFEAPDVVITERLDPGVFGRSTTHNAVPLTVDTLRIKITSKTNSQQADSVLKGLDSSVIGKITNDDLSQGMSFFSTNNDRLRLDSALTGLKHDTLGNNPAFKEAKIERNELSTSGTANAEAKAQEIMDAVDAGTLTSDMISDVALREALNDKDNTNLDPHRATVRKAAEKLLDKARAGVKRARALEAAQVIASSGPSAGIDSASKKFNVGAIDIDHDRIVEILNEGFGDKWPDEVNTLYADVSKQRSEAHKWNNVRTLIDDEDRFDDLVARLDPINSDLDEFAIADLEEFVEKASSTQEKIDDAPNRNAKARAVRDRDAILRKLDDETNRQDLEVKVRDQQANIPDDIWQDLERNGFSLKNLQIVDQAIDLGIDMDGKSLATLRTEANKRRAKKDAYDEARVKLEALGTPVDEWSSISSKSDDDLDALITSLTSRADNYHEYGELLRQANAYNGVNRNAQSMLPKIDLLDNPSFEELLSRIRMMHVEIGKYQVALLKAGNPKALELANAFRLTLSPATSAAAAGPATSIVAGEDVRLRALDERFAHAKTDDKRAEIWVERQRFARALELATELGLDTTGQRSAVESRVREAAENSVTQTLGSLEANKDNFASNPLAYVNDVFGDLAAQENLMKKINFLLLQDNLKDNDRHQYLSLLIAAKASRVAVDDAVLDEAISDSNNPEMYTDFKDNSQNEFYLQALASNARDQNQLVKEHTKLSITSKTVDDLFGEVEEANLVLTIAEALATPDPAAVAQAKAALKRAQEERDQVLNSFGLTYDRTLKPSFVRDKDNPRKDYRVHVFTHTDGSQHIVAGDADLPQTILSGNSKIPTDNFDLNGEEQKSIIPNVHIALVDQGIVNLQIDDNGKQLPLIPYSRDEKDHRLITPSGKTDNPCAYIGGEDGSGNVHCARGNSFVIEDGEKIYVTDDGFALNEDGLLKRNRFAIKDKDGFLLEDADGNPILAERVYDIDIGVPLFIKDGKYYTENLELTDDDLKRLAQGHTLGDTEAAITDFLNPFGLEHENEYAKFISARQRWQGFFSGIIHGPSTQFEKAQADFYAHSFFNWEDAAEKNLRDIFWNPESWEDHMCKAWYGKTPPRDVGVEKDVDGNSIITMSLQGERINLTVVREDNKGDEYLDNTYLYQFSWIVKALNYETDYTLCAGSCGKCFGLNDENGRIETRGVRVPKGQTSSSFLAVKTRMKLDKIALCYIQNNNGWTSLREYKMDIVDENYVPDANSVSRSSPSGIPLETQGSSIPQGITELPGE
jgi:hypothetical protein